jgi:hypothetical protein
MFSIRNLKLRYLILDLKILTLKKSVDPSQRNDTRFKLILVDLVDDEEEIVHKLILQTIDNARSKETEELFTHLDRSIITFISLYIGFGNRIIKYLM